MSKFTLGQRHFPTLGLRSQQPKNYVGPTLSCYLVHGACMSMSRTNTMQGLILTATEKCTLVVD